MVPLEVPNTPTAFQQFMVDGVVASSIRTHLDTRNTSRYILWSDVREFFKDVSYLINSAAERVFFEVDEEFRVSLPLRFKHSNTPFTVVRKSHSHERHMSWNQRASVNERFSDKIMTLNNPLEDMKREHQEYMSLHRYLERSKSERRSYFQKVLATTRYYHEALRERLVLLTEGLSMQDDMRKFVVRHFCLSQQINQFDHFNKFLCLLTTVTQVLEFASPRLFLVLPTDLKQWDKDKETTHRSFRLYFMCDFDYIGSADNGRQCRHVHLSNHVGYELERPQEFLRKYGHYVLTMLELVKYGFSTDQYYVPALDSKKILAACSGVVERHRLTLETIGPLVDRAMDYIRGLPSTRRCAAVGLTARETRCIKSYLCIPDGDHGQGGLQRHVHNSTVRWICNPHNSPDLNVFLDIIHRETAALYDQQRSLLEVRQGSITNAKRFVALLCRTDHAFDVELSFTKRSPSGNFISYYDLLFLLARIANSKVASIHINGISHFGQPHDPPGLEKNPFAYLLASSNVELVTLSNHPQLLETYAYLGLGGDFICGVTFRNGFKKQDVDWLDLRRQLDRYFARLVRMRQVTRKNVASKMRDLSLALKPFLPYGLKGIDLFLWENSQWQMHFAVVDGVIRGPSSAAYPPKLFHHFVLKHGTMQRLTVCAIHPTEVARLCELVDCNPGIYWIDIWFFTHELLSGMASIYQHWYHDPTELHIAVFEKGCKRDFRAAAKIAIGSQTIAALEAIHTGDQYRLTTRHGQQHKSKEPTYLMSFHVSRWTVDHPVGVLSDHTAALLDMAARQHPNFLTAFTLDTSSLSRLGLISVRNLFLHSSFAHLHIKCVPFDSTTKRAVGQVLVAAPWVSIKSLVLSGVNIEYWIRLWPSHTGLSMGHCDLALLNLRLVGAGNSSPLLSHESVLTLHRWIYGSKLLDVSVEAIRLEDERDWELVLGTFDPSTLNTLSLRGTSIDGTNGLNEIFGEHHTRVTTTSSKIISIQTTPLDKKIEAAGRLWSSNIPEMPQPKKVKAQGI